MLCLEVRPYRRPFCQPLRTAHGAWTAREGLILRFQDEQGHVTFGEIAPIPWFGTETLVQAQAFCDRWPRQFSPEQVSEIPDSLPACQFGFSAVHLLAEALTSAIGPHPKSVSQPWNRGSATLPAPGANFGPADICALLPTGAMALTHWPTLWQAGHRTFKWKIGVAAVAEELAIFEALVAALPVGAQLRLDANGGLTPKVAASWLTACDRAPITIEFLEQPLAPAAILAWLPQIRGRFDTAIALDESVATFAQLKRVYQQVGQQVVYVVKPAITGCPQRLLQFCQRQHLDVVLSSALETPVGRNAAFDSACELWAAGIPKRALGFGIGHWFQDDWEDLSEADVWAQL
ncbi:MAG: o-succinylbenzoate synthase [Leptolyngbya sp. SIOISBB]|nr:o-succinylbenzoate synthase [Leptolyngbya sp. SIOISBB]